MAALDLDRSLASGRANALLDSLNGRPVTGQRVGSLAKAITWLEHIANEKEPRGVGALQPSHAAALVNCIRAGKKPAFFDHDALFALEWIEAIGAGKPKPLGACAVYLIAASNAVKIGVSKNPQSRLSSIQTGHHDRLQIVKVWDQIDRTQAEQIEALAHNMFADWRLTGEWFAISPYEASQAIDSICCER